MGKIYEYSEIVNYRVPSPVNFLKAKTLILDELSRLVKEGEIYGAKIFGSVASGTPNERSDFDLLVITEKDSALVVLKDVFESISERTSIDIEPLIVDRRFAELGFHSIDKLFSNNIGITPVAENTVGKNPLDILKPANLSLIEGHEQYLIQKMRRFREGVFVYSEVDRNKVLQRALEAPINMGRETLQMLPYLGYPVELEDIGKQTVVNKFNEIFGKTTLINGFDYLHWQDNDYTNFLKETLNGSVRQAEYEDYVGYLSDECVSQAVAWTGELSLMYMKLLEGNLRHQEGSLIQHRNKESFR